MKKLYVLGMGPGGYEDMTVRCARILEECEVIVGYTVYVELLREYFPDKEYRTTPMTREWERCELAFSEAAGGRQVAMVCSGDAGIYGMAGLMLSIGAERYPEISVEVIPGVTAAVAGAALLGAPLIHDFAVISLSDRLTPWEEIEARLVAAAQSDFVLCLYNPASRLRRDYLRRACELVLRFRSEKTWCGLARSIGRSEERSQVLTLGELKETEVDMFTTVFIGKSTTRESNGQLITPRGYEGEGR